jgi:hypothetical protein
MSAMAVEPEHAEARDAEPVAPDPAREKAEQWRFQALMEIRRAQAHLSVLAINLAEQHGLESVRQQRELFRGFGCNVIRATDAYLHVASCKGAARLPTKRVHLRLQASLRLRSRLIVARASIS